MKLSLSVLKTKYKNLKDSTKELLNWLALIATIVPLLILVGNLVFGWFKSINTVDLQGSYQNESWKKASEDDYSWLVGEWFYPSIPDFYSRFKIEDGELLQQNEGLEPDYFKTEWLELNIYVSNNDLLRIDYPTKEDWAVTFIQRQKGKNFEFFNNERFLEDDGSVTSGKKRLVLNKQRCKVSKDGYTYDCK